MEKFLFNGWEFANFKCLFNLKLRYYDKSDIYFLEIKGKENVYRYCYWKNK